MYIRRTTIKSRRTGEPYYTYRLVESVREGQAVRQRTLLNLGRHFEVPREQWAAFAQRIEQIANGDVDWLAVELDPCWEAEAHRQGALLIQSKARVNAPARVEAVDYHTVNIDTLDVVRPRSVGGEHVALEALRQVGLDRHLQSLGFNRPQCAAAIGTIIARMVAPGSELATHRWLQQRSGLGELIDYDFASTHLMQLYRVSDQLLKHKEALERFLFERERDLFDFDRVITLYDLTNTYVEGSAKHNTNGALGKSKEKRTDCPLVTLALVLDGSGFPIKSEIFAGNVSEPKTLATMLARLEASQPTGSPTVVLDAGIATEENVGWLNDNGYHYLVVSRKRHRQFDDHEAVVVKDDHGLQVKAQRVVNPDTDEVELYCYSSQREQKEHAIQSLFSRRFEEQLEKLAQGLHTKRTVKRYDKVLQRLGRLKQKYARAAQYYDVRVEHDPATAKATAIHWQRTTPIADTHPGVYCLRTNEDHWDENTLWRTYTMLTDLEAVFRSLKSELGLRPIFHSTTDRVSGHLFISVLAYHLVHTLRYQLKASDIHLSWARLRQELAGHERVTVQMKRADGKTLHIRKATRAEPWQQTLYDALSFSDRPGRVEKTLV